MKKDLKLEYYASKTPVVPVSLYVYKLHSQNIMDSKYKVIRSAVWKIKNNSKCGVFENGEYIYTTEKVSTEIPNVDFKLEYLGAECPEVQENKHVYEALIKYYIAQNLEKVLIQEKYRKYSCKSNITSKWIRTEKGYNILSSKDKAISLERKYGIRVEIKENNYAYLKIDTSSIFSSNMTIADYIAKGIPVVGLEVMNDWAVNK